MDNDNKGASGAPERGQRRRRGACAVVATIVIIAVAAVAAYLAFGDCRRFNTESLVYKFNVSNSLLKYEVGPKGCPFWCGRRTWRFQTNYILDCGFNPGDNCQPPTYEDHDYCVNKVLVPPTRTDLRDRGW